MKNVYLVVTDGTSRLPVFASENKDACKEFALKYEKVIGEAIIYAVPLDQINYEIYDWFGSD